MSQHFSKDEMKCRHCGQGDVTVAMYAALERLRAALGPLVIRCGYRCPEHNKAVGGAPKSAHLEGRAVDLADPSGALKQCITSVQLEACGLWAEDFAATPTWLHVQVRPAAQRIFKP